MNGSVPGSALGAKEDDVVDLLTLRLMNYRKRFYADGRAELQDTRGVAREIVRNVAAVLAEGKAHDGAR